MHTKRTTIKDPCFKKPKAKDLTSNLLYTNMAKLMEQSRKNKKKKIKKRRQGITGKQKKTLAINNNTINISKKKKYDIKKTMCFYYNKKSDYANTYTKPQKN